MHLPEFCIDPGNRFTKAVWPDRSLQKITSCYKWLEAHETDAIGRAESPIIKLIEGGQEKTAIVGKGAQTRQGASNLHSVDKIYQTKYFLFGILPPVPTLTIDTLKIAIPDGRNRTHQDALQQLVGKWEFTKNGKHHAVKIDRVRAIDEGIAAYQYCLHQNVFSLPQHLNG